MFRIPDVCYMPEPRDAHRPKESVCTMPRPFDPLRPPQEKMPRGK